jgi:hypothetical protein
MLLYPTHSQVGLYSDFFSQALRAPAEMRETENTAAITKTKNFLVINVVFIFLLSFDGIVVSEETG